MWDFIWFILNINLFCTWRNYRILYLTIDVRLINAWWDIYFRRRLLHIFGIQMSFRLCRAPTVDGALNQFWTYKPEYNRLSRNWMKRFFSWIEKRKNVKKGRHHIHCFTEHSKKNWTKIGHIGKGCLVRSILIKLFLMIRFLFNHFFKNRESERETNLQRKKTI